MPDDVKTKELTEEGCQVIQTSINRRGINPVEDLKLYRTYHNMMKELKPDLVVTYTMPGFSPPARFASTCLGIFTPHA